MTPLRDKPRLTPLQQAMAVIEHLNARVASLEADRRPPVAVVGMACRFPGHADTPESFWQLLRDGHDPVGPIPANRWRIDDYYDPDPDMPGKMYVREGAFLSGIDQFDPAFFGLSPRETESMDPQQRLLLELAWEALEQAGLPPPRLRNTRTGVFVGIGQMDYARRQLNAGAPERITAYDGTGNGFCFAAGRLSYVLGLQGPSLALDTACSSSLAAVHLACAALRTGECDAALAGGAHLIVSPEITLFLSRVRALAPDGRCKAFDEAADGYGRGEGGGLLVLKRLKDAEREGDNILAVIRGSAMNHDGRSSGLTVPNGLAQQALLRSALEDARVNPADVSFLETHGTGTALGDPIEMEALASVYGNRPGLAPLMVGAVKTHIGHLEAAAGIAGLIQAILVMRHGLVPKLLHLARPSSRIPWDRLPVCLPMENRPWPTDTMPRLSAVSSFGFSGANVHVIVEGAPPGVSSAVELGPFLLPLSAKDPVALKALALRWADFLGQDPVVSLIDACHTAALGRTHFDIRRLWVADSRNSLIRQLRSWARAEPPAPPTVPHAQAWSDAYESGGAPDWKNLPLGHGRVVEAPTYPFQRQCYWIDAPDRARPITGSCPDLSASWPGQRLDLPESSEIRFASLWKADDPWMAQHPVNGLPMAPATAFISLLTSALAAVNPAAPVPESQRSLRIVALNLAQPLQLQTGQRARIQIVLTPASGPGGSGGYRAKIFSAIEGAPSVWMMNVEATVSEFPSSEFASAPDVVSLPSPVECRSVASSGFYTDMAALGIGYGSAFQCLTLATPLSVAGVWGRVTRLPDARPPAESAVYLLDSCLQLMAYALRPFRDLYLPMGCDTLTGYGPLQGDVWCKVTSQRASSDALIKADLDVYDLSGHRLMSVVGWTAKKVTPATFERSGARSLAGDDAFYAIEWQALPRSDASILSAYTPCPATAKELSAVADQCLVDPEARSYPVLLKALEKYATGFVIRAFAQLGLDWSSTEPFCLEPALARWGVVPPHRRYALRLFSFLEQDGWVKRQGDAWFVTRAPAGDELECLELAACAERQLLEPCGRQLAQVLKGALDPVTVVFPGGDVSLAERVYTESQPARTIGALLQGVCHTLFAGVPVDQRLRMLEIGAGTGGTTAQLLPLLAGRKVDYLYTDVSPHFLLKARERFADRPEFRYQVLDIEALPAAAADAIAPADLVIAANVLHATRDIRATLRQVYDHIAPGGWVLIVEAVQALRWVDLIFGMLEGWWKFNDPEIRPAHPLLSRAQWLDVFRQTGFQVGQALPADDAPALDHPLFYCQSILLAQKPALVVEPRLARTAWTLLPDRNSVAEALARLIEQHGGHVHVVSDVSTLEFSNTTTGVIDLRALDLRAAEALTGDALLVSSLDASDMALRLAQNSLSQRPGSKPDYWWVTRDAQSVRPPDAVDGFSQAGIWGLARVLRQEHPDRQWLTLDVQSGPAHDQAWAIFTALLARSSDDQLAVRDGQLLTARFKRFHREAAAGQPQLFDPQGVYALTGGTGGLGRVVARWMIERGAGTVVLAGRRALDPRTLQALNAEFGAAAPRILSETVDVTSADAVSLWLRRLHQGPQAFKGLIHAAGILADAMVTRQTRGQFQTVFDPKIRGAWNVYRATRDMALDFLVFFAAGAGVLGSPGQSNHAAASVILDSMAAFGRRQGRSLLSIDWGAWSGAGAISDRGLERAWQEKGVGSFTPEQGEACLDDIFRSLLIRSPSESAGPAPLSQVAALRMDWARFSAAYRVTPFLSDVIGKPALSPAAEASVKERFGGLNPAERFKALQRYVCREVAMILGWKDPGRVNPKQGLFDLGLDSLTVMELRKRLQTDLRCALSATLAFECPTIEALVCHLETVVWPESLVPTADEFLPGTGTDPDSTARSALDDLSEAQVAALLERQLNAMG